MIKKTSAVLFLFLCTFINGCMTSNTRADAVLAEAFAFIDQENYPQASLRLESLLQKPIQDLGLDKEAIHHVLAYCYEKQWKWGEAAEHYQKAISPTYNLADYATYRLAKSYLQIEDYPNALTWYERLIDKHPRSFYLTSVKYDIAKMYLKQGDYTKALDYLSDLIVGKQRSYVREATYEKAKTYEELQKWKEAQLTYQQLIDAKTSDQIARDALEQIQRLVKTHSNLKIIRSQRMNQGLVLYHYRKLKDARAEFSKVASGYKDTLTGRATYYIGRSYYRERKYDLAIKEYNNIVSLYPTSGYLTRALYQTTLCYRRKGQPDMAQKRLKAFVKSYSWSALADNASYDLGWVQENQKQYDEAIVSYGRLTRRYRRSDLVPQAYWRIGWIQFKNKRYAESIETFASLMKQFPKSGYTTAAHFWMAKNYERQNQWKEAEKIYREITAANYWYYGNRARAYLKKQLEQKGSNVLPENLVQSRAKAIPDSSTWKNIGSKKTPRVEKLMRLKLYEDAAIELKGAIRLDRSNLKDSYYNLIICYQRRKEFQKAHLYAEKLATFESLRDENQAIPLELYQLLYPVYYTDIIKKNSKKYEIDPLFVASMIREESRYNTEGVSWVGALGLMQIMPSTGRDLARRIKLRRFHTNMLFDPEINIQMGTWYMKNLMDKFENNHALVAGAYNGGPGRMQRWLRERDISDLDEFIEDISITETRRHIKKVIDSYHIYRELYSEGDLSPTQKS